LVALASWRAAGSLRVLRSSMSSGIQSPPNLENRVTISASNGIASLAENIFLFSKNA
jgi:hypothetical protein